MIAAGAFAANREGLSMPIVADVTCLACGCLCDDIVAHVEGGRLVEAENACPIGRAWFLAERPQDWPAATIDGTPVTPERALDEAAAILRNARSPIVLGLIGTSIEAQAAVVAIADRLGAAVGLGHEGDAAPRIDAFQRVGMVSSTLGEVKNRADLVVFWGVDPVATHPRHFERYSVDPPGRFVGGRRTVVVADRFPTATASRADHFLAIEPGGHFEALNTLRALVKDVDIDATPALRELAARMKGARYGALFFAANLGQPPEGRATIEAALMLARDLNDCTRFVALTLGAPGNPTGAEAVLAWQSGYPLGVDFAGGSPRFRAGGATAAILARGEPDAALIIGDPPANLPGDARAHLDRIPRIVVAPAATAPGRSSRVGLACGTPGLHAGGTVLRSDGVSLPLRPPLPSAYPTDREWLKALSDRLNRPLDARS